MVNLKHLETAKYIYRPTSNQSRLVVKIASIMDSRGIRRLDFPKPLRVASLRLAYLERERNHSVVLAHWVPQFNISTKADPMCSLFMLRTISLQRIYKYVSEQLKQDKT